MDSFPPVAMPVSELAQSPGRGPGRLRANLVRFAIVLLPLVLGIQRANASLYTRTRTFEQRVDDADVIPLGHVTDVHSAWEGGRIVSRVTFEVEDTWKGQAPHEITVRQAGGLLDGIRMEVSGAPKFNVGDRSVLFLRDLHVPLAPTYAVIDRELGRVQVAQNTQGKDEVTWLRPEISRVDVVPLPLFHLRVNLHLRANVP